MALPLAFWGFACFGEIENVLKRTRVLSPRNTWLLGTTKMLVYLFVCSFVLFYIDVNFCGIEVVKNRYLKPESTNEASLSSLLNLKDFFKIIS